MANRAHGNRANTRLKDWLGAFGAKSAFWLFGQLGLDRSSALGGWLGRTFGPLLKVHKRARQNLERAFPEKDKHEINRILEGMWDNLGRTFAEYAHIADFRLYEPGGPIEVVGAEWIDLARDDGVGGIFFSAHYGNWEILVLSANQRGVPVLSIYRAANNHLVEKMLSDFRTRLGGSHVPKGSDAAREMIKALKSGQHMAMLVDQKMNDGLAVPFFGRDAMTAPALAELALRYKCPIIPARVERLGGARFRLTLYPHIHLQSTGDRQADVMRAMTRVNELFESWIRERPDHWFWVHKRWPD